MQRRRYGAIRSFGLRSAIPPCCVLEYCLRKLLTSERYDHRCIYSSCLFCHCWLHRRLLHPRPEMLLGAWLRFEDQPEDPDDY
jgi:hypothetical protein